MAQIKVSIVIVNSAMIRTLPLFSVELLFIRELVSSNCVSKKGFAGDGCCLFVLHEAIGAAGLEIDIADRCRIGRRRIDDVPVSVGTNAVVWRGIGIV